MSRVLIVGGGKVGFHLAALLVGAGELVGLVERDPAVCVRVAKELGVAALEGDGTEPGVLEEAGVDEADYVVAVAGRDQDNLAVCRLAKSRVPGIRAIALIVDPNKARLYELAGIDATVDPATMTARTIRDLMPSNGMRLFSLFEGGDVALAEVELSSNAPVLGRTIASLMLPRDCVLIAIVRGDEVSFPRGPTVLAEADRVFALTRRTSLEALRLTLVGRAQ